MLHDIQSNAGAAKDEALRAIRVKDGCRALGMAVSFLMTEPSFARLPFGHWARVLVGQINRGHYLFAVRGNRIVGFVGWLLTDEAGAERWLAGKDELKNASLAGGDCLLINAWKSASPEVNAFLINELRAVAKASDLRRIFAKRFYPDGRVRPVTVNVSDFVGSHLARRDEARARSAAS
jgi:hemolysin-activating ACP:hemolysin acyltransferase